MQNLENDTSRGEVKTPSVTRKAKLVSHILSGKGRIWVGTSRSDDQFQRIVVTASDLHIHKHDIEQIEKEGDLELSWMRFWYDPNWEKMEPKWFGKNHNGKFWELMFVKDMRKPIKQSRRRGTK